MNLNPLGYTDKVSNFKRKKIRTTTTQRTSKSSLRTILNKPKTSRRGFITTLDNIN